MSGRGIGVPAPEIRQRRKRGEPRRLLIDAAVQLFNDRGYDATTRQIADQAKVSETLMFRHFGSKAGLFREAMIAPFVEFVDAFVAEHDAGAAADEDPRSITEAFVGSLYDIFATHRGLVAALWSATTHGGSDLAEAGLLDEVWTAFDKLVEVGRNADSGRAARNEIATRAVVSMVAGMAVADRAYKHGQMPDRNAVVDEITRICMYGRIRDDAREAT